MSAAQQKPKGRLEGLRVLLAEDEALIAMDIEHTLTSEGAVLVAPAFNSCKKVAAFAEADALDVDVAILDVALMDGTVFPAADVLQARGVPLAFHSGHVMQADMMARFPGCGWIVKPSHPNRIVDTMATLAANGSVEGPAKGEQGA